MDEDQTFMERALQLAEAGWGRVHPNPLVGAVLVRDGEVVGEGWHAEYGGPHAEVVALHAAREQARGATLYVTLEPCRHQGKTPPCTTAIIAAGIQRVVFGAADPSLEAGGGAGVLERAGVEVRGGVLATASRRLNAAFHHALERDRPFVALKLAMSLDARLSREAGRRTTVTGEGAQAEVHRLRAGYDAILIGRGTAAADDPELTVRGPLAPRRPPVRIIFNAAAGLCSDSRLARSAAQAPVWVVAAADADPEELRRLQQSGVRTLCTKRAEHGVDVNEAISLLWREGVRSILCEGGGRLAASLLEADAVQRIYLFVAPVFFGEAGTPAFPLHGPGGGWVITGTRAIGSDVLLTLERFVAG